MKKLFWYSVGTASLLLLRPAFADTLYDNSTTSEGTRYDPGTTEVGNEVQLAGSGNFTLSDFTFEYYGLNFSGGEQAEVRFYANDGSTYGPGINRPGTLLYDSGLFHIGATSAATLDYNSATLLDYNGQPVTVPKDFTFTVQYSSLGVGASAGVDLYSPASVGANYGDMWENVGGTWTLVYDTNAPLSIGAKIEGTQAVPEPTALMFGLAGGFAGLVLVFRSRRS